MAWHSAAFITVGGLSLLAFEQAAPPVGGGPVAVIVPPWQTGGMVFAAPLGLPVLDISLGGRIVVLETTEHPDALTGLGVLAFSTNPSALCQIRPAPNGGLFAP